MNEILLYILLFLNSVILLILFFTFKKMNSNQQPDVAKDLDRLDKSLKDEISRFRDENSRQSKAQREELSASIKLFSGQLFEHMGDISKMQKSQLDIFAEQLHKLTSLNEQKFNQLQEKVYSQLKDIQDNNSRKLEEMRQTVDEKLHATLEKRLGESFKIVSSQLDAVSQGLGEMKNLATGVGDLKKVLTNVKTRGTWGEIQLENLIEQILTPEQYAKNVATKKGSNDRVEFAVKMPGRDKSKDSVVWLPIDAKFPMEDYQRLLAAQDAGDIPAIEEASKALEARVRSEAKSIFEKYIDPPNTVEVGLLFLPVEGLFAELLRRPGFYEKIQNDFKVVLTGPTTLFAILNSLQMGFRTLAIEKRSGEVWDLLRTVKTEFGKFGDILEKTQKKLQEASNNIEDASRKSRTIERKLRGVQELPAGDEVKLLGNEGEDEI